MSELTSLAAEINREHNLAEKMAKTAIEHALKAGELLIEAKRQCKHDEWLPWLHNNLVLGARQAQRYMRLFNHRDAVATASDKSYLSIDEALAALTAPRVVDKPLRLPSPGIVWIHHDKDTWFMQESIGHPGYYYVARMYVLGIDEPSMLEFSERPILGKYMDQSLKLLGLKNPVDWDEYPAINDVDPPFFITVGVAL